MSALAPFTAALVGAGVGQVVRGGNAARIVAPIAIALGVLAEMRILSDNPGQLRWVAPLLAIGGGVAAIVLSTELSRKLRAAAVATALAVLLLAPGVWAFQTLGHATAGTFPAGGPATAGVGFGGPPGGGGPGGMFGGDSSALRGDRRRRDWAGPWRNLGGG